MDSLVMSRPCTFWTLPLDVSWRDVVCCGVSCSGILIGHLHLRGMCISRVATSEPQKLNAPLTSLFTMTALAGSFPGALRSWVVGVSLTVPCSTLEEQFFNLLWVDPLTRCNLRGGIGVDQALIPPCPDLLVRLIIRLEETFLKNVSLRIFGHNPSTFIHGNNDLHSVSPFTRVHPCTGLSSCHLSFYGLTEPVFSSRRTRTRTFFFYSSDAHRESIRHTRLKEC